MVLRLAPVVTPAAKAVTPAAKATPAWVPARVPAGIPARIIDRTAAPSRETAIVTPAAETTPKASTETTPTTEASTETTPTTETAAVTATIVVVAIIAGLSAANQDKEGQNSGQDHLVNVRHCELLLRLLLCLIARLPSLFAILNGRFQRFLCISHHMPLSQLISFHQVLQCDH